MGHNIEQGAGGIDVLLKFKGFVASVPRLLKLIVGHKVITLPENLGKLSIVPFMKISAPHICLCSSRECRVFDNCGWVKW
jgi:hypothetical protein